VNISLSHDRYLMWSYAISFYMDIFSAETNDVRDFSLVRDYICSLVSQEENSSLTAVSSFDEV